MERNTSGYADVEAALIKMDEGNGGKRKKRRWMPPEPKEATEL